MRWRKSSHSGHEGGQCVEVADLAGLVGLRDSKDAEGPKIILSVKGWQALTHRIKDFA
ncbi:DUF397 domain-containing protein [Actinomadura rupiterrae]|uniref:DUF397 domain-containing protein n=1 Tax=Actinomadura rupiterrae TaxID=559627 RepID=UPI0027E3AE0F|nr:DUF397 domain-containing protein [Actinomadura rupiterrae]